MKNVVLFCFVMGALSAAGEVIVSKAGKTVKFKCDVKPRYSRLTWTHGGKRIFSVNGFTGMPLKERGPEDILKRSKLSDTNLEVSDVKTEDAGKFSCQGGGNDREYTLIVVSVWVNPSEVLQLGSEATLQCEVKGLKTGTTVEWKRPDGGRTGSATVPLSPVEKSHKGKWVCLFSYDTVTYNDSVNIVVKEPAPKPVATKPTKISANVPPPAHDNSEPGATNLPPLLGLSWWIWVAIGVGSLVVFLLLVIVIVVFKRVRRKKRNHHRRQNGHQPLKPRQFCQCNRPAAAAAAKPQQGRRREKPVALPRQPLLRE